MRFSAVSGCSCACWLPLPPRHRPLRGILTGILTGALALTIAPPGDGGSADVIVRGTDLDAVAAAVSDHGGDVEFEIALIDAVSARVPSAALAALTADARVIAVTADAPVALAGKSKDEDKDEDKDNKKKKESKTESKKEREKQEREKIEKAEKELDKDAERDANETAAASTEVSDDLDDDGEDLATEHRGVTPEEASHRLGGKDMDDITNFDGDGVDVAVVDSGVNPSKALKGDRIEHAINLSMEDTKTDGFGHGTAMASIIAGDTKKYEGVGRGSRIIDVKVADKNGLTDVSQVLAGIDWVVSNRNTDGRNIRVMSLSFGTDGTNEYASSPLAYAVEAAWRHGIIVVVSAGNHGDSLGRLTSPAIDPYVIAVGAADLTNVSSFKDLDATVVPNWSAHGDGVRNPDIVAPGRSVLAAVSPGSRVYEENPNSIEGEYVLGSGTSHAAAFTAGVVAAMVEANPAVTPDEVKALLRQTAHDLTHVPATQDGAGVLNLVALFPKGKLAKVIGDATQNFPVSTGDGPLDGDRGRFLLEDADGNLLTGENTVVGSFDRDAWKGSTWSGSTWSGSTWSGSTWSGSTWSGSTWSGSTWSARGAE